MSDNCVVIEPGALLVGYSIKKKIDNLFDGFRSYVRNVFVMIVIIELVSLIV